MKHQFELIEWPEEFIVEFKDGEEQIFVSSQGVDWDDGSNLVGKDENRANISCCWKKQSKSQQKHKRIEFFIDEVSQFKSLDGDVIWKPSNEYH